MRPAITLLALVLALPAGAAGAADSATVALIIRNHQFEPAELEVPAGQKIELRIKNADASPAEFESSQLHREKVVPAGQEVVVQLGPLRAGRYEFFDDFHRSTTKGVIVVK